MASPIDFIQGFSEAETLIMPRFFDDLLDGFDCYFCYFFEITCCVL